MEALLQALAALLRGVASYPCARSMSRALFELCWVLRYHEEAAVRRGCLVGLCAVGRALIPAVLVNEFEEGLAELQDWLRVSAADDSDDGCRKLAAACHAIFGGAVREQLQRQQRWPHASLLRRHPSMHHPSVCCLKASHTPPPCDRRAGTRTCSRHEDERDTHARRLPPHSQTHERQGSTCGYAGRTCTWPHLLRTFPPVE